MIYVVVILVALALIYGPQLWVQWVLSRYNRHPEDNFPGTGGELARHLLDRYNLQEIKVEITDAGDHYDPAERAVRLTRDKHDGKTLTAITVAAHECGHAFQHAAGEPMFVMRTRLARVSIIAQRVGSFLLFAAPFSVLVTRLPSAAVLNITGAFLIMGFAILMHLTCRKSKCRRRARSCGRRHGPMSPRRSPRCSISGAGWPSSGADSYSSLHTEARRAQARVE
jgi:Zn-dependent membrane protease YugP